MDFLVKKAEPETHLYSLKCFPLPSLICFFAVHHQEEKWSWWWGICSLEIVSEKFYVAGIVLSLNLFVLFFFIKQKDTMVYIHCILYFKMNRISRGKDCHSCFLGVFSPWENVDTSYSPCQRGLILQSPWDPYPSPKSPGKIREVALSLSLESKKEESALARPLTETQGAQISHSTSPLVALGDLILLCYSLPWKPAIRPLSLPMAGSAGKAWWGEHSACWIRSQTVIWCFTRWGWGCGSPWCLRPSLSFKEWPVGFGSWESWAFE